VKKVLRWFLLGIVLAFIVVQFVPVERTNPPVEEEVSAPANVRAMLRRACYDCHSNETRWPWYSHVAPVSWLVAHDVHEARKHLNFSTWNQYDPKRQARKLHEVWEEVEEGEMPLWYYLAIHRDAALSDADRALLRAWATATPPESP
jgi:Haem-binding domain